MPASTLDPVNAALRASLAKTSENTLDTQLAGSAKKALLSNIEFEPAGNYQNNVLDKLKSKYIVLKAATANDANNKLNKSSQDIMMSDETLPPAKQELFPMEAVQLGWSNKDWSVGLGMVNMGNTCYLNSTLQALLHVPALVNWLLSDRQRVSDCDESGIHCVICAMRKTLLDSQQRSMSSIRPYLIYNKLRVVCRTLIQGRQEDAHEFLRYLVEAMEKSYLNRFKNHSQFDSRTKETTPLNQILGGYLRSAVRCLMCGHVSTTFQHFQDLLLDIRKPQTLEEALDGYFAREQLDDESYRCESCHKKVRATKQFSLERAPMVLCIQLKRFSVSNNKISKNIQFKQRLELTKYSRHRPSTPLVYRLVALVTHMGPTVSCGHYTAVAQAPCGNFYQFDDGMVRPISHQAVFTTSAYIMFYELERAPTLNGKKQTSSPAASPVKAPNPNVIHNNDNKIKNGLNGKVHGPELPPSKLLKTSDTNGATPVNTCANGNGGTHALSNNCNAASSSSDNDVDASPPKSSSMKENVSQKPAVNAALKSANSMDGKENKKTVKSVLTTSNSNSALPSTTCNSHPSTSTQCATASTSLVNTSIRKLVPYEEDDDDDDNSSEEALFNGRTVSTTAANGEWNVTLSVNEAKAPSASTASASSSSNTVGELLKMSHGGYSAQVSSWNGNRSQLSKEVVKEKREDRKRALDLTDEMDQGRVKHAKTSNGVAKSNPGYNPIQEYHNTKNWSQSNGNGSYNRSFYGSNIRHRNMKRFHHKNNYQKSYRYRN